MKQKFIVTVDTEEPGVFGNHFKTSYKNVDHGEQIHLVQEIFDKNQIKPVYFLDYSVVEDEAFSNTIKKIYHQGKCEIGAHMHPWCNPPFEEELSDSNSFFCNLDAELQERKLEALTKKINESIGVNPNAFRAGRFGFKEEQASLLLKFGYTVDSSVIPFTNLTNKKGPDKRNSPYFPYWIKSDETIRDNTKNLLEVPITKGFNRKNFEFWSKIFNSIENSKTMKLAYRLSFFEKFAILQKAALGIDDETLPRLRNIAKTFVRKKSNIINTYFHSSTLIPGGTPYVKTEKDLKRFLVKLDKFFRYLTLDLELCNTTLGEYREELLENERESKSY